MATTESTEAEIIAAQGEADAKRLEARAKLSSFAQVIYAIGDLISQAFKRLMKHGFYPVVFGLIVLAYVVKMIIDLYI